MQLPSDAGDARRLSALRAWALLVLVAVLAAFGISDARAACEQLPSGVFLCDTRAEAYAGAESFPSPYPVGTSAGTCKSFHGGTGSPPNLVLKDTGNSYGAILHCQNRDYTGPRIATFSWSMECPDGQTWDEATNKCACAPGSVPQPDGSCKSCSDLNGEPGSPSRQGVVSRGFRSRCVGGCTLAMTNGWCTSLGGPGGGSMLCSGEYQYTGASCSANPAPPEGPADPAEPEPQEEPPQQCVPAGSGQTFCIKPNGDQCYSASTGRQICWKPGETGDKGDGPTLQTRGPGPTPKPPTQPTTSAGDPYVQTGPSVTTTTTQTGGGGLTIVTTTQNHETESGTDAKPIDMGEPQDGSNSGSGSGDGDDGNSASGGGDCQTPPIASDPALAMIANQAWATRCAVEAGNAASVTGDVGDCASPFSVEGDNANAAQLRALRVQICGSLGPGDNADASDSLDGLDGAAAGIDGEDADLDAIGSDVEDAADPANWREVRDLNAQMGDLDDSGFIGSRSCPIAPAVDVNGIALGLNFDPICNMFINMSGLLIALAYVIAARIIAGVR